MSRGLRIGYPLPGTFSVAANTGSYSESGKDATLTYSSAGSGGNVGQVGSYANMNLATYPIYSIDMGVGDYGIMRTQDSDTGTGTSTKVTGSTWPLGGTGYCRITPPTTDGYERGINIANIWRNATLGIQDFNLRFEWRANSTFCSMSGTGPKFCIVHSARALTNGTGPDDRPVIFLRPMDTADNSALNRANTLVSAPSQETTGGWSPLVYDDEHPDNGGTVTYYPNSIQPYYHTNDGDTGTFQGNPKIEIGEVITWEFRIQTTQTVDYPRGLLALRIYRENGNVFERGIPWNWDTSVPFNAYIQEVQQFGCGQWNNTPGANVQWMDVGGYVTIARDLGGWLGRRSAA